MEFPPEFGGGAMGSLGGCEQRGYDNVKKVKFCLVLG